MNTLEAWAEHWRIPPYVLDDLRLRMCTLDASAAEPTPGRSEAAVQSAVRLEASRKGARLWRNNVGAGYTEDGSFLRWGLANDSPSVNAVLKSADLIGIRPRIITPQDVGKLLGQFVSRECKRVGWRYAGDEREQAQLNWAVLVMSLGGDASFASGVGTL